MRTKNARSIDKDESAHLAAVKSLPCGCCGRPAPSDAHHIVQGQHFSTIPLCHSDCHQGPHGVHGDGASLKVRKLTEHKILNATVRKIVYGSQRAGGINRPTRTVPKATSDLLPRIVPRRGFA
jgi:hypothetical protein